MKNLVLVALVLFILGSGYLYMKQSSQPPVSSPDDTKITSTAPVEADQTVNITGLNYAFDIKEIRAKKGEKIKIIFTNTEGFHDFRIDEFNVATKQIAAGTSESVIFTVDKTGTFEYYCSVGQHRANGMVGKLIVE